VLGSRLPEEEVFSTVFGKFKLEEIVKEAVILAPKSYSLHTSNDIHINKHKGAAKGHVNEDWFNVIPSI
jgi:uncharacterized protein YrzB (UPF0473 family)